MSLVALAFPSTYWLILAGGLAFAILVVVIILGYSRHWSWTGLPEPRSQRSSDSARRWSVPTSRA